MLFDEENATEVVLARNANAKDERLKQIMESVTRHLHAVVREVEPTFEEWLAAIQFLTAVGQISDDKRQEWSDLQQMSVGRRAPLGTAKSSGSSSLPSPCSAALPNQYAAAFISGSMPRPLAYITASWYCA